MRRNTSNLGKCGEKLAEEVLADPGFKNTYNLNRAFPNFPYADIVATKDGTRYFISVKARNRYRKGLQNGRQIVNSRYKLGSKCYEFAESCRQVFDVTAAWITISMQKETFCAYFGLLSDLEGNKGVPMSDKAVKRYLTLAENMDHHCNHEDFRND